MKHKLLLNTKPVAVPAELAARGVHYVFVDDPIALDEASRRAPDWQVPFQCMIQREGADLFAVYESPDG